MSFRVSINIASGELIPFTNFTLYIGSDSCVFEGDGTELTGSLCDSVEISRSGTSPEGYGQLWGYGTNLTSGNGNHTFGYGYGYGYSSLVTNEFVFDVTWTTPSISTDTTYDVSLQANAKNGGNSATYRKSMSSFFNVQALSSNTGGGGTTTASARISTINKDSGASFELNDDRTGIEAIEISAVNEIKNGEVRVYETNKPDGATHAISTSSGGVYKYVSITAYNFDDEDVDDVEINFKIPKFWFEGNDFDPETTVLKHYENGEWVDLPTEITGESGEFYTFSAETSWFSTFAIVAGKKQETSTPTGEVIEDVTEEPAQETETDTEPEPEDEEQTPAAPTEPDKPEEKKESNLPKIIALFVIIAVIVTIIVVMVMKMKPKRTHPLHDYIKHTKNKGHSREEIKQRLKEEGWDELIVEHHLNKHFEEVE